MVRQIFNRLYSDVLLPSRLDEYRALIEKALEYDFYVLSVKEYWDRLQKGMLPEKTLVLRHDIDTRTPVTRLIHDIEVDLNVTSSFYFRVSTVDLDVMRVISSHGSEVSYLYEELSTLVKKSAIHQADVDAGFMKLVRADFERNLMWFRSTTGLAAKTVASHGDFMNRRIGIANTCILDQNQLRERLGIELEAYDASFMNSIDARFSDTTYPNFWKPSTPDSALDRCKRIYVLTHPRHWKACLRGNMNENFRRLQQDVVYRMRRVMRHE